MPFHWKDIQVFDMPVALIMRVLKEQSNIHLFKDLFLNLDLQELEKTYMKSQDNAKGGPNGSPDSSRRHAIA